MPGHVGIPGNQPAVYLTGGNSGKNGSTQIRVLRKDNTEATYPGCYKLEVVSFDVLDENEDGINEPGEHLLVRNIKVINKGKTIQQKDCIRGRDFQALSTIFLQRNPLQASCIPGNSNRNLARTLTPVVSSLWLSFSFEELENPAFSMHH
jgi:hypothetical protein